MLPGIRYEGQRVSVTRHPFAGTARGRPRRLSLGKPAGLETDYEAYRMYMHPCAVPIYARTGRRIFGSSTESRGGQAAGAFQAWLSSLPASCVRGSNGWPDLSTANKYATSLRATASVARLR